MWNGPLDEDGYGSFFFRKLNRRAHRVALYLAGQLLAPKMVVDHKCPNRHCVNPQHLEPVTRRENALINSRSPAAVNAAKKVCPKGHKYDLVYQQKRGPARYCSICEAEKQKRLKGKWRAEDPLRGMV